MKHETLKCCNYSYAKTVGSAALHVYVMYQNISDWLRADYVITYKAIPTASHIYFHQKSITLVYVQEVRIMHSQYAQITFVNALIFPNVYFVFFNH